MKYEEYKSLHLPQIGKDILAFWEKEKVFEKSVSSREGSEPFVFYEGPPSANGMPGIHHVMARAIKDIFCRFQTLNGKQVKRKAGWDTHGLPIELAVEKTLGITKEDIGKKISVEEYNKACRTEVMKYTDKWEDLTKKMGYWVNMQDPYITYENPYIESVWYLLKKLYSGDNPFKQNLLYKNFSIQPYSPAAGTGLSSHELNQPGCYRNVKDTSAVVMFKVRDESKLNLQESSENTYFLAWTTTPWTLPSNTALAVGSEIDYQIIRIKNPLSQKTINAIIAKDRVPVYTDWNKLIAKTNTQEKSEEKEILQSKMSFVEKTKILFEKGEINFQVLKEIKGKELENIHYEQLLPYFKTQNENAFKVIIGDFVSTEDGTGIVHIAPTFGADDFRVAAAKDVPSATVKRLEGLISVPLVDLKGRFVEEVSDEIFGFAGEYVKEDYLTENEKQIEFQKQKKALETNGKIKDLKEYLNVDKRIVLKLQEEEKLFKKESYEHSYPHCWRTDKSVIYYPLESWFIKTTAAKERMIQLNNTINWKPEATGTGRFGNWLENLNDWNLSRSRFWGIPLPIWRNTKSHWGRKKVEICVGSISELKLPNWFFQIKDVEVGETILKSPIWISGYIEAKEASGVFDSKKFLEQLIKGECLIPVTTENLKDLHKPFIDQVCFIEDGEIAVRESDLIDVWFDSGAMPYAQLHYPFENKDQIDQKKYYPADFIAEGVDQTRGWFFTLHAIATMCFDSVAYKNVVSNGLVLDKSGNKMSKRLGNAVDPFVTIEKYGADATRWYMIANAAPWDNLKFDEEGISEVQRKLFGTLYNIYNFYALYANIDQFLLNETDIVPVKERVELDRWIISKLQTLIVEVTGNYEEYEPHKAARAIEEFVDEHLSNWYVRLSRRRFWKGEMSRDKRAAYETLHECLAVTAQLMSPIAPFFSDWLYRNLSKPIRSEAVKNNTSLQYESVHLTTLTVAEKETTDKYLEEKMTLAQKISSMVLSIRKKENIRVRQPLKRMQIPVLDNSFKERIEGVKDLILSEVNVKGIDFVDESTTSITKNLKLNFKTLGKKCGKHMKAVQAYAAMHPQEIISGIEKSGRYEVKIESDLILLEQEDVEIIPVDIPGWKVANDGAITVALDITITPELKEEGIARELINRIQGLRKDKEYEVTDRIALKIKRNTAINKAVNNNLEYICTEILAASLEFVDGFEANEASLIELEEGVETLVSIDKLKN